MATTMAASASAGDGKGGDASASTSAAALERRFRAVASLIRGGDDGGDRGRGAADGAAADDDFRLLLYGYYKCATSTASSASSSGGKWGRAKIYPATLPRPSFLDPVGRAKRDAWIRCRAECGGDALAAMGRYVELAAGRVPGIAARVEAMDEAGEASGEEPRERPKEEVGEEAGGDGGQGAGAGPNSAGGCRGMGGKNDSEGEESDDVGSGGRKARSPGSLGVGGDDCDPPSTTGLASASEARSVSSSLRSLLDAVLPPPLVPRGRLDVSYYDLLYALFQCSFHAWCSLLVADGVLRRAFSFVLPDFAANLTDAALGRFHPRRRTTRLEEEVGARWRAISGTSRSRDAPATARAEARSEVVTGLSVRSLLDLYLSAQRHPQGAEVVVAPPVSIRGMLDVMAYHGLVAVPVDLPAGGEDDAEDSAGPQETTRWGIDLAGVREAVSDRTVAILVVHPFGAVIADDAEMRDIRRIADERGLEVWEDCAQCYAGTVGHGGSGHAELSLWSFGPIKTGTALGGGIAEVRDCVPEAGRGNEEGSGGSSGNNNSVIRNGGDSENNDYYDGNHNNNNDNNGTSARAAETARAMRRIRDEHPPQTNRSYALRVLKCLALHVATGSRRVCGLVKVVVEAAGGDYDAVVVALTRGFRTTRPPSTRSGGRPSPDADERRREELIRQLRRRPCPSLLSLLLRRLRDSDRTAASAARRLARCRRLARRLCADDALRDAVVLPKHVRGGELHGWLFPALVPDPDRMTRRLLRDGFDAPRGATQLGVVPGRGRNGCPRARAAFDRVLYLPATAPGFSGDDDAKLARTMTAAVAPDEVPEASGSMRRREQQRRSRWTTVIVFAGWLEWSFSICGLLRWFPFRIASRLLIFVIGWAGATAAVALFLLLVLSRYVGPDYVKPSRLAFARHCGLMFRSPFDSPSVDDGGDERSTPASSVLELESTRIPTVSGIGGDSDAGPRTVVLTGATGFVGSLLLRELLLHRRSLAIPGGVVIVLRRRGDATAQERADRLLADPMFDFMDAEDCTSLVRVVEGDLALPDCGMPEEQIASLCKLNISHVFHCAASVSFSQTLEDAAMSNITPSLQLQQLTHKLGIGAAEFVYISTAFAHGGCDGRALRPLREELYPLGPYDPSEIYLSMLGPQSYASAAMRHHLFANTYTFSKSVCEHLLLKNQLVKTRIIRPSIIGPSACVPFEGWAGPRPSTLIAAGCLYVRYPYLLWCLGCEPVPVVPVDVVCRFILSQALWQGGHSHPERGGTEPPSEVIKVEEEKKETSLSDIVIEGEGQSTRPHANIANAAWDISSPPVSSFSWASYITALVHIGAASGRLHRSIASLTGLFLPIELLPRLRLRHEAFRRLHLAFVRLPLEAMLGLSDQLPWLMPGMLRDLKDLSAAIDLPVLFFLFTNCGFYFESDLVAPPDFDGEQYMFSCAVAAHRFVDRMDQRRSHCLSRYPYLNLREHGLRVLNEKGLQRYSSIVVGGTNEVERCSDLWWALTQPRGNLAIRLGGWILAKVFRRTARSIEVDIASFEALAKALSDPLQSAPSCIVFAPTHRSFFDFLIVSYVCFSLPELGLDLPYIAAASEFASIPVIGWLAQKSGAFFLKRGGLETDHSKLKERLSNAIEAQHHTTFVEFFIEGKRSRNRVFVKPKTGFLRCLAEIDGQKIVLPITINYEGLPDERSLVHEANSGCGEKMSLLRLANWLFHVFSGRVDIGRVHVSASKPIMVPDSCGRDIRALAHKIQSCHQSRVMVSNFHIGAAKTALDLPQNIVCEALLELGCPIWPECGIDESSVQAVNCRDMNWAAMLQFGHLFGPFMAKSHPIWSSWLCPDIRSVNRNTTTLTATNAVLSKLIQYFERAEHDVDEVLKNLRSKGFHAPTKKHIIQYLPDDGPVPMFVMQVAVEAKLAAADSRKTYECSNGDVMSVGVEPRFLSQVAGVSNGKLHRNDTTEAFGAWGYQDSYFVLNVKPNGSKFVTMKGTRYSISGKPLMGLVGFIEEELNVAIDPSSQTVSACQVLQNVPGSELGDEDISEIIALLGGDVGRVSLRSVDRARHGTGHTQEDMYDLRTGIFRSRLPDAVVWPQTETEVRALVSLAIRNNWCLIPFGGGTNVTHSTHCPNKATDPRPMISVDMKLMCRILWVNEEDGLAHVEAGITGAELIQSMAKLGFTIGHEPDSYEFSTLGGWIATKASGMKQNKYGNIEDIIKEVYIVGTGSPISHKHKTEKTSVGRSSIGVEMKSLMLGSEGCCGIIVRAVLKIWPIASSRSYESVILPDFDAGLKFMKDVSKMRSMKPASVRLLDNEQFRLGQALKESPPAFQSLRTFASKRIGYFIGNLSHKLIVCVTMAFEGTSDEVKMQKKHIRNLASTHGGILAGSTNGRAGYDLTFAIAYLRDFALNYNILGESFETFAPWSKVAEVIAATKNRIVSEHKRRALPGTPFVCCRITQLYDDGACIYFYFCMQTSGVAEPSSTFSAIEKSARQVILDKGGSLSHHHGVGKLRSSFVEQIYSQGYIDSVVAVKKALDPTNTFGARNGIFSQG